MKAKFEAIGSTKSLHCIVPSSNPILVNAVHSIAFPLDSCQQTAHIISAILTVLLVMRHLGSSICTQY